MTNQRPVLPEARPLGQDQLQLRRGPASDQGPDQGQGVGIEVGLEKTLKLVALFKLIK